MTAPSDEHQAGLSQIFVLNVIWTIGREIPRKVLRSIAVVLNSSTEKRECQSKDDVKGQHFEAWPIVQAVTWYLSIRSAMAI